MSNYTLLIGPDKLVIDTAEIGTVSLNLSIKDINNFGQRNASFSKPIQVFHTKNTDLIFKGLFNINSINPFDDTKKIEAELLDDGLTILKGSLQVISVTPNHYECIIFDNFINLFTDLGDKYITGNLDSSLDLYFDPSYCYHTLSRQFIIDQLNVQPNMSGLGYVYPIIDYDGNIDHPDHMKALDYPLLPAPAARQIFDKILEDNGYSYTMDAGTKAIFNTMYIPWNGNFKDIVQDWPYMYQRLGHVWNCDPNFIWQFTFPAGATAIIPVGPESSYGYRPWQMKLYDSSLSATDTALGALRPETQIPYLAIKGMKIDDDPCTGNFNYLNPDTLNPVLNKDSSLQYGYRIPADGTYDFTFGFKTIRRIDGQVISDTTLPDGSTYSWLWYRWLNPNFDDPAVGAGIRYMLNVSGPVETFHELCQVDVSYNALGSHFYYNEGEITGLSLKKDQIVYPVVWPKDKDVSAGTVGLTNMLPMYPVYDTSTWMKVTKKEEYVNIGKAWNMNSMLPRNYKQVDFINDVFKTFNFYITFDQLYNKRLTIKTFDQFYADSQRLDWSDKIVEDTVSFYTFKNTSTKRYVFTLAEDGDFLNQDYKEWKKDILYTHTLVNDSEFATGDTVVGVSYSPTAIKNIASEVIALTVPKIYEKEHTFKTDWNHRLLFFNSVDYSYRYGILDDASSAVSKWRILSPKMYNDTSTNNVFIGFNTSYTYQDDITVETNRNLYNLYYKSEIEPLLNTQFKVLTCKIRLNSSDIINIDFNSLIYINNKNFGNGVYRINSIRNYNPDQNVCDIELNKLYKLT